MPIWRNKNILRMIRKKKRRWRWYTRDGGKDYASFQVYRDIQKEVKKEVRQGKKKLEKKLAKGAKKNSKQFTPTLIKRLLIESLLGHSSMGRSWSLTTKVF